MELLKTCLVGVFLGLLVLAGHYLARKILESELFQTLLREHARRVPHRLRHGFLRQERHRVRNRAPPLFAEPMRNVPNLVAHQNQFKKKKCSVNHPVKTSLQPKSHKKYFLSPKSKNVKRLRAS